MFKELLLSTAMIALCLSARATLLLLFAFALVCQSSSLRAAVVGTKPLTATIGMMQSVPAFRASVLEQVGLVSSLSVQLVPTLSPLLSATPSVSDPWRETARQLVGALAAQPQVIATHQHELRAALGEQGAESLRKTSVRLQARTAEDSVLRAQLNNLRSGLDLNDPGAVQKLGEHLNNLFDNSTSRLGGASGDAVAASDSAQKNLPGSWKLRPAVAFAIPKSNPPPATKSDVTAKPPRGRLLRWINAATSRHGIGVVDRYESWAAEYVRAQEPLGLAPAALAPMDILAGHFSQQDQTLGLAQDPTAFKAVAQALLDAMRRPPHGDLLKYETSRASKHMFDYEESQNFEKKLLEKIRGGLSSRAHKTARALNLRADRTIYHGTSLQGLAGMLLLGSMKPTRNFDVEAVWGMHSPESPAAYAIHKSITGKPQPGVIIIIDNPANPIRLENYHPVNGGTMHRTPMITDFAAAIISDGDKTVVLDHETLQALADSARMWKHLAKEHARQGQTDDLEEWERIRNILLPSP